MRFVVTHEEDTVCNFLYLYVYDIQNLQLRTECLCSVAGSLCHLGLVSQSRTDSC